MSFRRLVLSFLFLGLGVLEAAEPDALKDALSFRQEARRHRSDAWLESYIQSLLGSNYKDTQPELGQKLKALAGAQDDARVGAILGPKVDKAAAELLSVAATEAPAYRVGRPISRSGLSRITQAIPTGPKVAGEGTYRVENAQVPEPFRNWLYHEQKVNDKINNTDVFASLQQNDMPRELDPTSGKIYWLPMVEVPIEEARLVRAPGTDLTRDQVIVKKGGQEYVRFFIHPTAEGYYASLIKKYGVQRQFLASATASPRSLLVWDAYNDSAAPFLVKTSLPLEIGQLRRMVPQDKIERGVGNSATLEEAVRRGQLPQGAYMPEMLGVMPPGFSSGMIVRDVPKGTLQGKTEWIPGFALVGHGPGQKNSRLIDMIEKSGMKPHDFVNERVIKPMLSSYAEVAYGQGLVGEPHQQNVLFEIGKDGLPTGRVMFRDLDSYKVDVELRARKGLTLRPLTYAQRPTKMFKTSKGNDYYNTSYELYIREDIGYMIAKDLGPKYPGFSKARLYADMDATLAEEAAGQLGMKIDPKAPFDASELVKAYKAQAAAAPNKTNLSVPQEVLRAEFKRSEFNYRAMWVDKALTKRKTGETQFLLHDGAIEWRVDGKTAGFGFLEPPDVKNFYRGVKHPRKKPTAERLARLYDPYTSRHTGQAFSAPRTDLAEGANAKLRVARGAIDQAFDAVKTQVRASDPRVHDIQLRVVEDPALRIDYQAEGRRVDASTGLINALEARASKEGLSGTARTAFVQRAFGLMVGHELSHARGIAHEGYADRLGALAVQRSLGQPSQVEIRAALESFGQAGRPMDNLAYRLGNLARYGTQGGRQRLMASALRGEVDAYAAFRRPDGTVRWGEALKARATSEGKQAAAGLAHFTLALFLKELAVVVHTGDRERISEFFDGLLTTDFFVQYGAFSAGAYGMDRVYTSYIQQHVKPRFINGALRSTAVMAAGMALAQVASGQFDGRAYMIDVAGLGLSSAAVKAGVAGIKWVTGIDKVMKAGKLTNIVGFVYSAGELAVVLYFGDRISDGIDRYLSDREARANLDVELKAGEAALADKAAGPEAIEAALDRIDAAFDDYRNHLFRDVAREDERLRARLVRLAADAKTTEDAGARLAALGQGSQDARLQSLRGAAQSIAKEQDANFQTRVASILEAHEKATSVLLADLYTGRPSYAGQGPWTEPSQNRLETYAQQRQRLSALRASVETSAGGFNPAPRRGTWPRLTSAGTDAQRAAIDRRLARLATLESADRDLYEATKPQPIEREGQGLIKKLKDST